MIHVPGRTYAGSAWLNVHTVGACAWTPLSGAQLQLHNLTRLFVSCCLSTCKEVWHERSVITHVLLILTETGSNSSCFTAMIFCKTAAALSKAAQREAHAQAGEQAAFEDGDQAVLQDSESGKSGKQSEDSKETGVHV